MIQSQYSCTTAPDLRHWFLSPPPKKTKKLSNVTFLGAAFVQKAFRVVGLKYKFPVAALFPDFPDPKLLFARINESKTYLFKAAIFETNVCYLSHYSLACNILCSYTAT